MYEHLQSMLPGDLKQKKQQMTKVFQLYGIVFKEIVNTGAAIVM